MTCHHDAVVTIEPVTRQMRRQFALPPEASRAVVGHWDGADYLLTTDAECRDGCFEAAVRAIAESADAAFRGAA